MKRIKNLTKIGVLTFMVSISILACSEKLEEQEGQLNAGDIDYTATENMIDPLIGAYQIFATRGWEEPLLLSVRGDDVNSGGLGDQQPFTDTDAFNYDNSYWMYNSLWNLHYGDIVSLHTQAELVNNYRNFADPSEYARADQYLAEIKVLRAWFQFNLARVWDEVFIVTSNQPNDDIANGVATKEETMQYISDLMDEAIPFLPDSRPNERTDVPGGVTRHTAYAIKAMANLEMENYQGVADAAGAIINSNKFSLHPSFYDLFKKPGELSNENLLEMQFSDFSVGAGGEFYHLYAPFGPTSWTPARANAEAGWGFYEPSVKWIKFMLDRGEEDRLVTSVLFTPEGIAEIQSDPQYASLPSYVSTTTPDGDVINTSVRANFFSGKHYLPSNQLTDGRNNYGGGKNFIVIRYAEVLLMYAEALTRGASGNGLTADQAVNIVRDRVDMSPLSGVTSNQVMDEKFAEMAMEWGIRYYDMIRLDNYEELNYDGRTFSAAKEYLPYPQDQINALPLED